MEMATTATTAAPAPVDGRRLRPERNRRAVVEAILDLLDQGVADPGVDVVAAAAGVSVRSVFRYFDDLDALALAAVERQVERTYPLWAAPSAEGSLDQRIAALVTQRQRLFEAIAPARRYALRRSSAAAAIRAGLATSGRALRAQVADQLAPELRRLAPAERRVVLDALDTVAGWAAWEHLRTELGRSAGHTDRVTRHALRALLAVDPPER